MRVIVTTSTYPLDSHDYWGNFVFDVNRRMAESGNKVVTVVPRCSTEQRSPSSKLPTEEFSFFLPRKAQTLGCPPGLETNIRDFRGMIQLPFYLIGFTLKLLVSVLRHRPNLIHANWAIPAGLVSLVVGKLTRTPVIVTVLGADVYLKGLRRYAIRFTLERVNHVVACSNHVKRLILEFVRPKSLSVIPNSVDYEGIQEATRRMDQVSIRGRLGASESDRIVLTVRRLVPEKRVKDLVEAAAKVLQARSDVLFVIAGDGPERESLENLSKEIGIDKSVRFACAISDEEKIELLSVADICVHTSVQEGLSLALLEFMAAGALVIASASAGQDDSIVHCETGLLFKAEDSSDLAEKILLALSDDSSPELVRRATSLVENEYSTKHQTGMYLDVYERFKC